MPALNAPGIDAAPPDSVTRPSTGPGAGGRREGTVDGPLGRCGALGPLHWPAHLDAHRQPDDVRELAVLEVRGAKGSDEIRHVVEHAPRGSASTRSTPTALPISSRTRRTGSLRSESLETTTATS